MNRTKDDQDNIKKSVQQVQEMVSIEKTKYDQQFKDLANRKISMFDQDEIVITDQENQKKVDFQRWLLIFVSFANLIFICMVLHLAIWAHEFLSATQGINNALIFIQLLILTLSCLTIYATIKNMCRFLLFQIYLYMVLIAYLIVYAAGCYSFTPDIQEWIYNNWDLFKDKVEQETVSSFIDYIEDQIVSLGTYLVTIAIGLSVSIGSIVYKVSMDRLLATFIPTFALIFIVLCSGSVAIAMYAKNHVYAVELDINLPIYVNDIIIYIGIAYMVVGAMGYFASIKRHKTCIWIYLVLLSLLSIAMFVGCLYQLFVARDIEDIVAENWDDIRETLYNQGYYLSQTAFTNGVMYVFKFAGIYGVSQLFFQIIGITGSFFHIYRM